MKQYREIFEWVSILYLLSLLASAASAQEVVQPSFYQSAATLGQLVEIKLPVKEEERVIWIAVNPRSLDFRSYKTTTDWVMVFSANANRDDPKLLKAGLVEVLLIRIEPANGAVKQEDLAIEVVEYGPPIPIPPKPIPPKPPDPEPVPNGKRAILVIRETEDSTPEISRLITSLQGGAPNSPAMYIREKGHTLSFLDDDSVTEDGKSSPYVTAWRPFYQDLQLPAILIIEPQTGAAGKVLYRGQLPKTAVEVIDLLKRYGG